MKTPTRSDDPRAISTILTKTQRLLKIEADNENSAFHKAQLLLSEYMVMLTEAQSENSRLRRLLGSYVGSAAARKQLPASLVIAALKKRIVDLNAAMATLRGALEKIRACESEAAQRNPGEIAAHALREIEMLAEDTSGSSLR